jgi:hypothetical protein
VNPRFSDSVWACASGASLVGIAAFVMFVIRPGGFESAIGWFFVLLPGAIPASLVSDRVYKSAPNAERVIYWALIIGVSFVWYWGLSVLTIKIFRTLVRTVRR